jgi:hypothetical protein
MSRSVNNNLKITLRWIARVLSSLSIAFFLFMVIGETLSGEEPLILEGVFVGVFALILAIAVLIAWFKEKTGGVILVIAGVLFAIFIYITAGTNKLPAAVLISAPFWISGVLFWAGSYCSKFASKPEKHTFS